MKRILVYLVILSALAAIAWYVTREKQVEEAVSWQESFAVEDTASITKIFLTDKSGAEALLLRENGHWTINNKYRAAQPQVNNLLETIKNVRVSYPVPYAGQDNVVKQLSATAVKIEVYTDDDKPAKVYYIGTETADGKGTFMLMQKNGKTAERPYVTHIPGFVGFLTPRYFIDEKLWRDLTIFDYGMDDIQSVKVEYPKTPQHSFHLKVVGADSFNITPLNERYAIQAPVFKQGVSKYLNSFQSRHAEALENEFGKKDSILATTPLVVVEVTDQRGQTNRMQVYTMPVNKRSKTQYDQFGNPVEYDVDRYYALINNGSDFAIIQQFVFGNIFRHYDDFFVKDKQPS